MFYRLMMREQIARNGTGAIEELLRAMDMPAVIKLNKEFRRAYYRGSYRANPVLVTYLVRTNLGVVRYGITSGKKVGNAVSRNRARRIIRAAFCQVYSDYGWDQTKIGLDFIFVARERTPEQKSTDIYRAMSGQIRSLLRDFQKK